MTRDIETLRAEHRALAAAAEAAKKAAQDAQYGFYGGYVSIEARWDAVDAWYLADDLASRAWRAVVEAEANRRDGLEGVA